MRKKPAPDCKTCESCESYKPVNPGDEAGYCHLSPPVWIGSDGEGGWTRPPVARDDICRAYQRKLNS